MLYTGKYERSLDEYDIDHEINAATDKTLLLVAECKHAAKDKKDARKILKAVMATILDEL